MSQPAEIRPPSEPAGPAARPAGTTEHIDGFSVDATGDEAIDRKLAQIEMAGEEAAAGWKPKPHEALSPEVRYLHVSRTIHELILDRNRSVGIFLFVASLFFGASSALLSAPRDVVPMIPLAAIQYWCLPVTFGTLAIIGGFVSLILIRARIGLIYEVTKMNALLGLPSKRVERVNPLSIFFLMHALVVLLGGASAGLSAGMLFWGGGDGKSLPLWGGFLVGLLYVAAFQAAYYLTILRATSDSKLNSVRS